VLFIYTEALSSSSTSDQWRAVCRVKCKPISATWALLFDLASWVQAVRLNKLEGAQMGLHLTSLTTLHRSLIILEGAALMSIYKHPSSFPNDRGIEGPKTLDSEFEPNWNEWLSRTYDHFQFLWKLQSLCQSWIFILQIKLMYHITKGNVCPYHFIHLN
jgi:hypothetical protein